MVEIINFLFLTDVQWSLDCPKVSVLIGTLQTCNITIKSELNNITAVITEHNHYIGILELKL